MDDKRTDPPTHTGDDNTEQNNTGDNWGQLMSDFGVTEEEKSNENSTELTTTGENNTELSHEQFIQQPTDTLEASMTCVKSFLPESRVEEINTSLREIEYMETNGVIGALREKGELTEKQEAIASKLVEIGLESDMMTPEEAEAVYRYEHDSDETIREQKVEEIADLIAEIRTGVKLERAWSPRQERFLDYITSKYYAYEHGRVRTDLPCDIKAIYLDHYKDAHIDDYRHEITESSRISYEDIPYTEEELGRMLGIPVEDITDEQDYLENYGDETYVFAYGPFTYGDLDQINGLCSVFASYENDDVKGITQDRQSVAWVQPISSRLLDRFVPVIRKGEVVGKKHIVGATNEFRRNTPRGYFDVERGALTGSLTTHFIAKEVLKNRRPKARDLVALATSVGETVSSINEDDIDSEQKATLKHLKTASTYMSKYILEAIHMDTAEAKELYGKARPTSKEFYEEARTRSEAWTDAQCEYYDTENNSTMIKLYDWLLQCEAAMLDLGNGEEISTGQPRQAVLANIAQRASRITDALDQES